MFAATHFFRQLKDLAVFGFGARVIALVKESVSQTAVASHGQGVLWAECVLFDRDKVAEHGFGLGVVLIPHQSVGQAVAIDEGVRMREAENLFFQSNDLSILRSCLSLFTLGLKSVSQT